MFKDERFAPRSTFLKRELKKPLKFRFILNFDLAGQVVSWQIAGPLSEHDVQQIARNIKKCDTPAEKGEIKLLIDNRSMIIDGQPFVFAPEVYDVWEELQSWLLPYVQTIIVLCNSKFMKNQLDRLTKRSSISSISKHIFHKDFDAANKEALAFLSIQENRILTESAKRQPSLLK